MRLSRPLVIVIGIVSMFALQHVPAPDTLTSFAVGEMVGMVLGVVLGVAFVYGEGERPQ